VYTPAASWDEAKTTCESLSAGLVKINGAEENDFVLDLSKQKALKKVWIGLKWYRGDDFYWYDYSAPNDYTNWAPDQPNGGANEQCGSMYTEPKRENLPMAAPGYWNDINCDGDGSAMGLVCKRLL